MPNFILSEYFIDNKYIYLLLVKFFCKQVNYLLKYLKKLVYIISSENN